MKYREKKVMSIGIVCELTGLSERQIRYYEERKLIFPERTNGKTRKYSFTDVERLVEVAEKIEDGWRTHEIREKERKVTEQQRSDLIRGQLNAAFGLYKKQ
ncbi:MerR family transcriptional regulator [Exiguobacterium acetylicum]|uniref:MerR family transcriptional regulator n=1 Tax=Exiguobacterium TaxID=33986 RepID=UPI00044A0A5F|nr:MULTISPECIES: MerR family transcriptional regulator [Exiguobacterium]EZP62076.1 Transcriptional regulator, MerR family [Exiguobacterium sp. RIT341]KQS44588.1 MerR family transcriptional regulator [Exiguobacterium sp. Leaf196]MDQ6465889.1 MerR family transcriptional regulator [Exiguobacterium acetylicum]MDT0171383.1 MerR family transcriptional regulator [Exiguobacterium sp. BRG2]HAB34803.1 MerR family DNA-binding transcriptional regulator [Exiguobacterium sp.]